MTRADSPVQVFSEIGKLKRILLHRPGSELESLTPQYLDSMLFEDIPFLARMQEEHDDFAATLQDRGCDVLYVDKLLKQVLATQSVRVGIVDKTIAMCGIRNHGVQEQLRQFLHNLPVDALARHLIAGVRKDELDPARGSSPRNPDLSYFIRDEYPFYLNPLPNLYFTRDPGSVLGNAWAVHTMQTEARRRETLLLSTIIHNWKSMFPEEPEGPVIENYSHGSSIEGGDVLVLNQQTIAVGCSARTETWAIEELANNILKPQTANEGFSKILVVQIPFTRAYMHLDTVFTMVDYDKFTIYPGVEPHLRLFTITKNSDGTLKVTTEEGLQTALKRHLGLPAVDLIKTGGGDRITAAREQWNDSTNTLAIAPGVVVTYRRNMVSNDTLEKHGVTVLPIHGSELVRGRVDPAA